MPNMSSEQPQTDNPLKYLKEVTDQNRIAEYDKLPLYVPEHESPETFDQDLMNKESFKSSAETIGQIREIEVAIWEDDPNKSSQNSHERVHLRILNGRHRYMQIPDWKRRYFDFSNMKDSFGTLDPVMAYYEARQHFDLQKKSKPEERTMLIEEMAEHLVKSKGLRPDQCCNEIVNRLSAQGVASESAIRNACPRKYKDLFHVSRKEGKTFESTGKDTVEVKSAKKIVGEKLIESEEQIKSLTGEKTDVERKNIVLKQAVRDKDTVILELQTKIKSIKEMLIDQTCDCGIKTQIKVDTTLNKIIVQRK